MELSFHLMFILIYCSYEVKNVHATTTADYTKTSNYSHFQSSPTILRTSIPIQEQTFSTLEKTTRLQSTLTIKPSIYSIKSIALSTENVILLTTTTEQHVIIPSSSFISRNHSMVIVCIQCVVTSSSFTASATISTEVKEDLNNHDMVIIIVAVTSVTLIVFIIIMILCCCKRNKQQKNQKKNSGRKASVFKIFGRSTMLAQIELEENENYAPCDAAFFNDYFQKKDELKKQRQPTQNKDSSTVISNEINKEQENQYASLNRNFVTGEDKVEIKDTMPIYNSVHGPEYNVLEPLNEPEYKVLESINEPEYDELESMNEPEYKELECNIDKPPEYHVIECDHENLPNVYANPYTDKEFIQNGYQSLPKKTRRNVSDSLPVIKVTEDEKSPFHQLKNPVNALKQTYARSASVPNFEHLNNNNRGIHKSGSDGGKYDTEDYVFM